MNPASAKSIHRYANCPHRCLGWLAAACLAVGIQSAPAADARFVAVLKSQQFVQNGPDLVALNDGDSGDNGPPLRLEAFAEGTALDSLVSGTLQPPTGPALPLVREESGDTGLRHTYRAEHLLDLNTARPNGSYTLQFNTQNDGAQSITLNLTGETYPEVPKITNFTALQTTNYAVDTIVEWSPMTSGTAGDFILLTLSDGTGSEVFSTPLPGSPGALTGTAGQATVPANTLLPGHTYEAELIFVKIVDRSTSYSFAFAGYSKMVTFEIRTVALPGTALGADIERSIPPANAQGVAQDSAISFRFTHPMNPAFRSISWTGNGLNPADFSYQWLDGNRLLLCTYLTVLPAGADIGWNLNLAGFRDAANFPLNGSRSGTFQITDDAPASPPDVSGFHVIKSQEFQQTATTAVGTGRFGCDAAVELAAFNRVKEPATITLSGNGLSTRLTPDEWDQSVGFRANYASKSDLDRFCPNGGFTFNFTTLADGSKTLTLGLGAVDDYPAAPVVTNLAALQAINPATATTFTWNPLADWNPAMSEGSGLIELEIENDQGNEVLWIDNEQLTSSTQFTVPANTFWPGRTYRVSLAFLRIKQLNDSYGDWGGACGFRSVTQFAITTTGTPLLPKLTLQPAGGGMNLNFPGGESQRSYVIETSRDLTRWLPQEERFIGAPPQPNSYYDDDARYLSARTYRLRDRLPDEWVQRHVTLQGTVWTNSSHTARAAGATVGTSLDGRTTVTDANGRFFLETDTAGSNSGNPYTLKVSRGGPTKEFGPTTWGDQPRELQLDLE